MDILTDFATTDNVVRAVHGDDYADLADVPRAKWGGPVKSLSEANHERTDSARDPIQEQIDAIPGGLTVGELQQSVSKILTALARHIELDELSVREYISRLRKHIRKLGYGSMTQDKYVEMYRVEAKRLRLEPKQKVGPVSPTNCYIRLRETTKIADQNPAIGIVDRTADNKQMTNFEMVIERETEIDDDLDSYTVFSGKMLTLEGTQPFQIRASDYACDRKLQEFLYEKAGAGVQINCKLSVLRNAVAQFSGDRLRQQATTDFGWNEAGDSYGVPSGRITAERFIAVEDEPDLPRVDLSSDGAGVASNLDLTPLQPADLLRVKQHIVADLLTLHDRKVTYALLGSVASAVLYRFGPSELGRYDLWLMGLTGSGKSFTAKLFQSFFGDFMSRPGQYATWLSTPFYLQMQGYYFKDAIYLVDDYKPNAVKPGQQQQIISFLQTYADNTARGRLSADSRAKKLRPVRGILVSTGEDMPEHSASTIARSIMVRMPNVAKDLKRGGRCVRQSRYYSGVMADFIGWLLKQRRTDCFAPKVRSWQHYFLQGIQGQQNDSRIAGNLALLAASLFEMAKYLGDVWTDWRQEVISFLRNDLVDIRDTMLDITHEQQESEVFLAALADLVKHHRVQIEGYSGRVQSEHAPIIGKVEGQVWKISRDLALAEVQDSLRKQGKPLLRASGDGLIAQLRQDGKLLDCKGKPFGIGDTKPSLQRLRLDQNRSYCFIIDPEMLLGKKEHSAIARQRGLTKGPRPDENERERHDDPSVDRQDDPSVDRQDETPVDRQDKYG